MKVAVTGAAGQIGYALLFRIAAGEMFGPQTRVQLSLLELEAAMPALNGVAMELEDCAYPLLESVQKSSNPDEAFAEADWALLVGSVPRQAGMERKDLLQINGQIFVRQGQALDRYAKPSCKVLVVGNPCNTNAYVAKEMSKKIPPENFFAMTMLDQNRAVAQLALKAGVPVREVENMIVWGNHSSTLFPDFFHTRIKGEPLDTRIKDSQWLQERFLQIVQQRGAEIIKARGKSSAASAAQAVLETVRQVENPSARQKLFSLGVCSDGSYGIEKGLIFSFPVVFSQGHGTIAQGISHNQFAREMLQKTLQELQEEKMAVQAILPEKTR